MAKIKVNCYSYKKYYNLFFSPVETVSDRFIKIFEIFQDMEAIILFDVWKDYSSIISLIEKDIYSSVIMSDISKMICIADCDKGELINLLKKINMNNLEGIVVVGKTDNSVALDELSRKMLQNPLSIMRQKNTDIMLESNFDENEMIISVIKTKYTKKAIKSFVLDIFGK